MTSKTSTLIIILVATAIVASIVLLQKQSQVSLQPWPVQKTSAKTMAGRWEWSDAKYSEEDWDNGRVEYLAADLLLDLKVQRNKVSGQLLGTITGGHRVESCPTEKDCIHGTLNGNIALVDFETGYARGRGTAKLTY